MKWITNTDQFAVIDDFLSKEAWEEVHKYMELASYMYVGEAAWNGAWRLDDGLVMRGPSVVYGNYEPYEAKFPTGTGIDLLIQSMVDHAPQFTKQLGEMGVSWEAFTALPMLYPKNTGLYWHRDAPSWAGSYTYYVHREWNVEWGGALLIADESVKQISDDYGVFLSPKRSAMGIIGERSFGAHIDNTQANTFLMQRGIGSYIMPKPNRLVIISQGNPHSISKVHHGAGDHLRISISGFFQRPKG